MAGIRGKSGPPGNQNAFRHGLAGIAQRRANGVLNPQEQAVREEILSGLLGDKARRQISAAMRVLTEIIRATCRSWLRSTMRLMGDSEEPRGKSQSQSIGATGRL